MNRTTLDERETIVAIAESYKAVEESCLAKGGHGDSGYGPQMAEAWREGTYEEFGWCLKKMHHHGDHHAYHGVPWKTLRAHIVMYWINVERVQRTTHERIPVGKGRKKKSMLVPRIYMDVIRHKDAREQKAEWGIDVVQLIWPRHKRLPWLPNEVFQTAVDNKIAA